MEFSVMPGRLLFPFQLLPILFFCEAAVAGMAVLAMDDAAVPPVSDEQVYGRLPLLACCVIGSVAGALLAVGVFVNDNSPGPSAMRKLSLKFGSSQLSGMVFTPMISRYLKLSLVPDNIVGVSALVAFLSVATLHKAMALWDRHLEKKYGSGGPCDPAAGITKTPGA